MNKVVSMLLLLVATLCLKCSKEPKEIVLPNDVEFEHSITWMNGNQIDYQYDFHLDTLRGFSGMSYAFTEKRTDDIINAVAFGYFPLATGTFKLTVPSNYTTAPTGFAPVGFHQIYDEDTPGYSYKLEDPEEGFINIEMIDSVRQEVKGRFKVKFCRTSKNGNSGLGTPKVMLFQGVFYEKYIKI